MTQLKLEHTQTGEETGVLTAVAGRILSLGRIAVWCLFAAGLTLCLVLSIHEENLRYGVPLALLAGLLFVGTLVLLGFALHVRPRLLASIRANEGATVRMVFTPERMTLTRLGAPGLKVGYRCVLGQYWFENFYILHLRIPVREGGRGEELFVFPLTPDTFDLIYALAEALTGQGKKLVRLRGKRGTPGTKTEPSR